ncbi:MFS transporter [Pseudonocardia oroxyli]|uniref:Predicted arabinose efflux permease, MFS family n=1 Tax=Pseudonocardia oroxyli TaxID=366584 RepID=A0A1G7T1C3_PSEOR|nr:MFS transporter [Pseudonocardia oroxyli]SDG29146.1 Predicted arabinose efflux permease, MFS family [Pseudonocardia oroxyli]
MSVSLADYRSALSVPGATLPVVFSAIGRLPIAMYSFGTLLYVQRAEGSFATAGLVSAGSLVGVAIGTVAQGRLMDRRGPSGVLLVVSTLFALAAAALVAGVEWGAPVPVVVGLAFASGLVMPAMPAATRALWERLVSGRRREAALSYEAISLEVFFILGPGLAALLASTPWPGTGTAVAVVATVIGAVGFALTGPVRATPAMRPAVRPSLLGAIGSPGMRTAALSGLGFGLVVGAVELGVPAVAGGHGEPWLGGALLSAWSVTSVIVGVLYGMRPWPRALHLRMPVLVAGFGVLVLLMWATASSLPLLVVAMLLAGGLITPQTTGQSLVVDVVAPPGTQTEAFGWVVTAITVGAAVGQSVAGTVVEAWGASGAFAVGGVAGVLVGAVLWLRRRTIESPADVVQLSLH